MIDGYKIHNLPVDIDELLNNNLLLFPIKVNEKDGEILNKPRYCEYKGQSFIIKNNNVKLKGSFHKYSNNGEHNYNDFYFSDLINVISDLSDKFNFNPLDTYLNNLEFGVNIVIPIEPEKIFKYAINYKGTPFQKFNLQGAKGIECIKDNFIIKIYDKGHQYKLSTQYLLRFEIKVIKMQYFTDKKVKIKTLADLLNINEICKLTPILKCTFNDILFYDYSIKETDLTPRKRLILSNGTNPKYWENLLPNSKDFQQGNNDTEYKKLRKKYYRELGNFKNLIYKYSTSTLQKDIAVLIEKKSSELLTTDIKTRDKLTDLINSIPNKKGDKLTDFENNEKGQINILNIVRICPVSNLDISMQKPESKFLCIAGIKYYYENEKEIYYQLEKRLSAKWRSEPIETQFREIAHSIRNEYNNPKLNPKNNLITRKERIKKTPTVFDSDMLDNMLMLSVAQRQILNKINSINN